MKREEIPTQNPSKSGCHTKCIVLSIRVTVKDWNYLLEKSGGNISGFIRRKLGLEVEC